MAAIYMWFSDEETIVLTTTLYPVDVSDGLVFSATVSGGQMGEIWGDFNTAAIGPVSASYIQKRWYLFDDAGEDFNTAAIGPVSASYIQKRWYLFDDAGEDFNTAAIGPVSGSNRYLLVEGDTPDESLQISITINDTCTMDLI